jgi:hypothetical protein
VPLCPRARSLRQPVLQVGDVVLSQSNAILTYVGKLAGLVPSDPLAAAKVDEVRAEEEGPPPPFFPCGDVVCERVYVTLCVSLCE